MPTAMLSGNKSIYNRSIFIVCAALLISMAFSHRVTSSIAVILMPALVLLSPDRLSLIKRAFFNPLFLSCLGFLVINAVGIGYTSNYDQNIKETTAKAGIAAIPFFFCAYAFNIKIKLRLLISIFTVSLFAATLYCLSYAYVIYRIQGDSSVFFYHTLLSPLNEHAVYYSFYLLFCVLYWLEEGIATWKQTTMKAVTVFVLLYFFLLIILLSSKMVLGLLFVYMIYYVFSQLIRKPNKKLIAVVVVAVGIATLLLITTDNPVKKRFIDLTQGSITLFQQERFNADTYFNGLQFRLLTWRFTGEILREQNAWLTGVSAGDGKSFLQKKYIATGMYQGDGVSSIGYLQYDCHNIYLQTTLESGLPGLATLLAVIIFFLRKLVKSNRKTALLFFLCLLIFGFTESYLSRQYGIVLFCFMPLLLLSAERPDKD